MPKNNSLQRAAKAQQDEFYTDVHDIEHELMYYKNHFRNKVIFYNCDYPYHRFTINGREIYVRILIRRIGGTE